MTSGRLGRQFAATDAEFDALSAGTSVGEDSAVAEAVARTRDWLLARQHEDGHWCGELEGDTILESEYILLLAWLGREREEVAIRAAKYIREQQLPEGGWAIYPGGPIEISASVKAYFTLKLTGHDPGSEEMIRARDAILAAGGAERVNSFTRYYLALLGVITYRQVPAVPPELMLVPRWLPLNVYEMSAWSRTIVVPLSILWAHKPVRELPPELGIRELFVDAPEKLDPCMPPCEQLDDLKRKSWINWRTFFRGVDRVLKFCDRVGIRPFRKRSVRLASEWMTERFADSDGLGAIFPPIIWSVVALKCLGHDDDSPLVKQQLDELERLILRDDHNETVRLQPCKSPVWDTSIATLALREAGVSWNDRSMTKAVDWMLSKEVRTSGDWATLNRGHEAGGWFFEYENRFYPDVDDTSMVTMALARCLPDEATRTWSAEFFLQDGWSPHEADRDTAAVVAARADSAAEAVAEIEAISARLSAIRRGIRWILAMQNRDGGWGAFDKDNDRELFTRVPFADHNAMIDPSTADLTARVLETYGRVGVDPEHPVVQPSVTKALANVTAEQEADGAWYGRWGVNYLYGTWQALVGLEKIGVPHDDPRMMAGADWIASVQQASGGWGETPRSYDDPSLRGRGPETASQTAWALMGLMAAGRVDSEPVARGVAYLLDTQNGDGSWDEPWWTGTGFPKVFYLKYHLYRITFPLMALARYDRLTR